MSMRRHLPRPVSPRTASTNPSATAWPHTFLFLAVELRLILALAPSARPALKRTRPADRRDAPGRHPDAERMAQGMDHLDTAGNPIAGRKTFPTTRARALARRPEIHAAVKHSSWLKMAKIELSVLSNRGLKQHPPDLEALEQETSAWEAERNQQSTKINGKVTTDEVHSTLNRLYPTFEDCQRHVGVTEAPPPRPFRRTGGVSLRLDRCVTHQIGSRSQAAS